MKYFRTIFLLFNIVLIMIFSNHYTQENRNLRLISGALSLEVDMYNGKFSLFDTEQTNVDLASLLFGLSTPDSYIDVRIDNQRQTFDQMKVLNPFGQSVGSQIDGIFLAGPYSDVRVENAFFTMDIQGNSDFNTVGIALNLSNESRSQTRKVCVKIMLDTDIGESTGDSLIYLSSGQHVTNAFLLSKKYIPPYLFAGMLQPFENTAKGQGLYVYPYLSTNTPHALLIGNWRRISDSTWIPKILNPSLKYSSDSSQDIGVALYFGPYVLEPNQTVNFGVALSKSLSIVFPILEQKALSLGVFSPQRSTVEEMLHTASEESIDIIEFFDQNIEPKYPDNTKNRVQQEKRQKYRRKMLSQDSSENKNYLQSNLSTDEIKNFLYGDALWNYMFDLNIQMKQLEQSIDKTLESGNSQPKNFDSPPIKGIIATNLY